MSFLKAIEEGKKLAKKQESLQEPKKKIAKKLLTSKDNEQKVHAIYQAKIKELEEKISSLNDYIDHSVISATSGAITQYENTIKQLETEKYNIGKNYNQTLLDKDKQIKELEEEIKKLNKLNNKELTELQEDSKAFENRMKERFYKQDNLNAELQTENTKLLRRLQSQEGSYNSQIEVMQNTIDNSISPEQMADLRSSWNEEHFKEIETWKTRFQEMKYSKEAIQQTLEKTKSSINNKSPSEYVELLKNDQTKTELVKNLHDRMFKVKHKGKAKNYNSKYAIEIFRLGMEWRNLQKE